MKTNYLYAIGIFSLLIGSLAFWNSEIEATSVLLDWFIGVAAIVFGVLGALLSILKPVSELDEEDPSKRSNRTTLALQISPAFKQATFALAAVILLRLSLPVVEGLGGTLETLIELRWPKWDFPEAFTPILQALVGTCIVFLYLFETVILILTLLPILVIESTRKEAEFYKSELEDPASKYMKQKH